MPNPATVREQRLRKTKAQLIDEINSFERRVAALEVGRDGYASGGGKPPSSDDYLASQALLDLAKFPSENPNPVLRVTPEGGLLYANDAARAVGGLLTGRKKDRLPSGLAKVATEVSRTAAACQPEFHSGDRTLALALTPVAGESYINVYGRDITERKRAEGALRESEERYALAMQAIDEGVFEWNVDTDEFYYSPGIRNILGLPVKEVKSRQDFLERMHPDDRRRDRDAYVALFKGETERLNCDVRYRGNEGEWRWTRQHAVAVRDEKGRVHRVVGASADITEIKQAEEAAAEAQALLNDAIDCISEGFALYGADDRLVLCNNTYRDLWGYSDTEVAPGVHWDDLDRLDVERGTVIDEGSGMAGAPWRAALSRRRQRQSIEIQFSDGRWVTIRDRKTAAGGSVTIQTDITELKRAEEELARKEAQLRVALDNMPGGIMLGDRDLNYVLFNSQYSELHEFPDGLIGVGGSFRDELRYQAERGDFGPGDKDDLIEQVVATNQSGEAESYERTLAGGGRTIQVYLAPTPEGGYVTIVTDITERKRAEEALLEAKQRSEEASKLVAEKNRMLESLSKQLSKYLSPQVYTSIFSGEQSVEIASKRKKLTVFFSDIADFAGTTDSLESEELTNLLNLYLTEMSKIALDHGATIDKYVGDAIIAFFGDPETRGVKEDARACVSMAVAMQRRMRELRSEWLDMGLERPFELRIGINTGYCTVGNFGSADRMDYTIIGNEVNLAARLEARAEVGGILMTHATHALVKDTVLAEEGETLTVKGFAKPVRTYSVVGLYDDLAEQGRIILKEQGGTRVLVELKKGDKADAIKAIKDVLSQLED